MAFIAMQNAQSITTIKEYPTMPFSYSELNAQLRRLREQLLAFFPASAIDQHLKLASEKSSLAFGFSQLIQRTIIPERKTIAVIHDSLLWNNLGDELPAMLRERGFNILILSLQDRDASHQTESVFSVDQAIFEQMRYINVCIGVSFTIPEWLRFNTTEWVRNLDIINVFHASRMTASSVLSTPMECLSYGRYSLVSLASDLDEKRIAECRDKLRSLKIPAALLGGRKEFFLLPQYPSKIARIRSLRNELRDDEIDRILICPSISDLPGYFTARLGLQIVSRFLNEFPGKRIVFRPRPEDRDRPEVKEIRAQFSVHQQFVFDEIDDYAASYARGVMLITDVSSTGQTFSLSTGRPTIFLPVNGDRPHTKIAASIGFVVEDIDTLVQTASRILAKPSLLTARIERVLFDLYGKDGNSSSQALLSNIERVVADEPDSSWIRFELSPNNIIGNTAADFHEAMDCLIPVDRYFLINRLLPVYLQMRFSTPIPDRILRFLTPLLTQSHSKRTVHLLDLALRNLQFWPGNAPAISAISKSLDFILSCGEPSTIRRALELMQRNVGDGRLPPPGKPQSLLPHLIRQRLKLLATHGVRRLILLGAGKHTRMLMNEVSIPWGINIQAIVDENPDPKALFGTLTPCRPDSIAPASFDAVILSTDYHQELFRSICKRYWPGKNVVDLYEGLPPGPYDHAEISTDCAGNALTAGVLAELVHAALELARNRRDFAEMSVLVNTRDPSWTEGVAWGRLGISPILVSCADDRLLTEFGQPAGLPFPILVAALEDRERLIAKILGSGSENLWIIDPISDKTVIDGI